jgi:RNA polymerase sigma-70 factor (ECF subfamily)
MSGESDDALLAAIQLGDETALRALLLRHYAPLCRFAHGFTRQADLAEEAVSCVFETLWRRRARIRIAASAKAWLYGAVRLQALDRRRAAARRPLSALDEAPDDIAGPESGRCIALREEIHEEVERLVAALPPQRQLVFRLNRFDGLRYREIAEALQISEQTVQNHMVLAMRQLAPALPRLRELVRA